MEIPGTKQFIRIGFELGTTLSWPIWPITYQELQAIVENDQFEQRNNDKIF